MKDDLREKLAAIFAMSKAKLKLVYPDEHPSTHDKLHIANVTLEGLDEMIALSVEEIEALFVALLDEVMGKVIGEKEPLPRPITKAQAIADLLRRERNKLRTTQRQALQAIRDSVSGGKREDT